MLDEILDTPRNRVTPKNREVTRKRTPGKVNKNVTKQLFASI